jgi:membrane protein
MSKKTDEGTPKKGFVLKLKTFLDDIYLGEKSYSRITTKIVNAFKIFVVSSRKFLTDDCYTKASSIAYTTIVSLIPTLTVGLTFYSIFKGVGDQKEDLFRKLTTFMLEHNIKLNIDPIVESLSSLIENAGKIGGIGAIVMVFTATAVLRTLEKSLNDIWKVKKQRSIFLKLIYYWAALTLGPIMVIAGTTVATQVSAFFSSPNYRAASVSEKNVIWVAGNKCALQYSVKNGAQMQSIPTEKIDFENQRMFEYDTAARAFKEQEFRLEEIEFAKTEFTDVQFIGATGWAVAKNGIILSTQDSGATWSLDKWGSFGFRDIHMLDRMRGFIAADYGVLLQTSDGGKTWSLIDLGNFTSNLNSIDFYGYSGIITADRGIIFTTNDAGKKWEQKLVPEAKKKKRYVNLNRVSYLDTYTVRIAGDEGTLLTSYDSGKKWTGGKVLEKNYYSVYFEDDAKGFVGGEKGTLLYTVNAGDKWQKNNVGDQNINQIMRVNGELLLIGGDGTFMLSKDGGKTWTGKKGRGFLSFFLNFFAPFVFIWLLFLLAYLALPNIKVPFNAAALGASFTGAVWVGFILFFIVYVKAFASGTFAVYGGLAAFPLFLLLVYSSTLIILYGAELAYTIMHPHTYLKVRKSLKGHHEITLYYGIAILHLIYRTFEKGQGATYFKDLMKITANKADEVEFFIALFKENKLINENADGSYLPSTASKNVVMSDIFDLIHDMSLVIPSYAPSDGLKKYFHTLFSDMQKSRKDLLGATTLQEIIEQTE